MAPFPLLCLMPQRIFLQYLPWESGGAPGGKSHILLGAGMCVGGFLWLGPLDLVTLRLLHAEPPAGFQLQVFLPGTGSHSSFCSSVSALVSFILFIPLLVSPFLGVIFCPVCSPLLGIQEKLFIVQLVQLFTYCWNRVVTSKLLAWRTGNWVWFIGKTVYTQWSWLFVELSFMSLIPRAAPP